MTDIVERLRKPPFGTETSERNIMNTAADEIERLRELLEDVIVYSIDETAIKIAREALEGK